MLRFHHIVAAQEHDYRRNGVQDRALVFGQRIQEGIRPESRQCDEFSTLGEFRDHRHREAVNVEHWKNTGKHVLEGIRRWFYHRVLACFLGQHLTVGDNVGVGQLHTLWKPCGSGRVWHENHIVRVTAVPLQAAKMNTGWICQLGEIDCSIRQAFIGARLDANDGNVSLGQFSSILQHRVVRRSSKQNFAVTVDQLAADFLTAVLFVHWLKLSQM